MALSSRGRDRITSRNASFWTVENRVLFEGELGIEIDTGKQKYGDGVTAWQDLPYTFTKESDVKPPLDAIQAIASEIKDTVSQQRDFVAVILNRQTESNALLLQILDKLNEK